MEGMPVAVRETLGMESRDEPVVSWSSGNGEHPWKSLGREFWSKSKEILLLYEILLI